MLKAIHNGSSLQHFIRFLIQYTNFGDNLFQNLESEMNLIRAARISSQLDQAFGAYYGTVLISLRI